MSVARRRFWFVPRWSGTVLPALLVGTGALLAVPGCTSHDGEKGLGSVDLGLQVAGAVGINAVSYLISGPGSFSRAGVLDVSHSATLSGVIGSLPVGTGFTVALDATATDGATHCAGTAPFAITAQAVTSVSVRVQCHETPRTGSLLVNGAFNVCPVIDGVSANPGEVLVGHTIALAAIAHDTDGAPQTPAFHWSASSGSLGTFDSDSLSSPAFTCTQAGTVTLSVAVNDGDCTDTFSLPVTCTGAANVRINEVESSGGVPGDWVELFNAGSATADISGWKFKDNDDSHAFYVIPSGTVVPVGGFYLLEEAAFVFGLGAADSARLYDAAGNVVDSYSWTAHASTTYGRCPNGIGSFGTTTAVTKGAANPCGAGGSGGATGAGGGVAGTGGTSAGGAGGAGGSSGTAGAGGAAGGAAGGTSFPWPGTDAVVTVDDANFFGTNLSGLNYQPATATQPAVLWAIQNGPSKLYRLLNNGTTYAADTANGWSAGKLLHYTNGTGAPDSEGLSKAEWADGAMYVSTERDNNVSGVSRLSILRFDTNAAGTELTATHDWNLTADLPVVGPNLGLEAITYLPDTALVAGGFVDQSTHALYNPSTYPNHGTGLFFVGLEGNGSVYGYALDHVGGGFTRVATLPSGQVSIMDLAFDRETGLLWGYCDNTCGNKATVFRLDSGATSPTLGQFSIGRVFDHPSTLPNSNNEGITFGPESECVGGQKPFFWSDDDQLNGHALRRGTISCGTFF